MEEMLRRLMELRGFSLACAVVIASICGCATTSGNVPFEIIQPINVPQLRNPRGVPPKDISADLAFQIYDRLEQRQGKLRWFFIAFDSDTLVFGVGKYKSGIVARRAKDDRYILQKIYRVERTPDTEEAFDVVDQIRAYEEGVEGVTAGMKQWEVLEILGPPKEAKKFKRHFDYHYDDFSIRFIDNRVYEFF